ncbi:MAG: L-lactate transporter [Paraeggerthella hongkongensis]
MQRSKTQSRANVVLIAGVLFNLSISLLYSWSVIKSGLTAAPDAGGFGWSSAQAGLPYTIAIVFFALGLLGGGIVQDRIGPRKVITAGGLLAGMGMVLSSFAGQSVLGVCLTYGVLTGTGIGLGYGCVTPCALKWFDPFKKGLVAGLVVGGFGLAAVYLAPATQILIEGFGISQTFLILGIVTIVVSVPIAQLIKNPETDYVPASSSVRKAGKASVERTPDRTWRQMVRTKEFYLLFALFALSSSVGLMIIGNLSKIATIQDPASAAGYAALLVSLLALFNTGGRVVGGILSDKIGRINTLVLVFAIQCLNMCLFALYGNFALLTLGALFVGFSYGTLLSVFPSMTADLYGLRNYGTNYGILYLAWGLSGVLAPVMADVVFDVTGTFDAAYLICAAILALCILLGVVLKRQLNAASGKAANLDREESPAS